MNRILALIILLFSSNLALAEAFNFDMGSAGDTSSRMLQMVAIITVLSLAPSIIMMVTSFTRIVVVMSFLRSAIGLQQSPPNSILISLSLFLTLFIMSPTIEKSYHDGILPLVENKINEKQAFWLTVKPFSEFMIKHTREKDLDLFLSIAKKSEEEVKTVDDVPLQILIPAFMISELRRAFEIGFLVFVPFLIIDLLISSLLMAMGMMMLPPVMIALPFKLIFFVITDGWYMICGSLVKSYGIN
ncbi:Flagellar biosynthetic protein FliP precursor [Candidatus Arcanobacter lacustris]|jgi:flagellar biosynthetic protein FliP|uniref:Flagellar biosynthetic protein FliP n=1 Tax=Candidatus Arcanibacter lacustris TaxID=1607817 RepID=A0A0F5MPB0_9RICK|nr:Flagellar biosynthetic protein FliP precursor [Candidatus Arcanobacter lacustris]